MIRSEQFVTAARERGLWFYSGVPCSHLAPFINHVIDSPLVRYVAASNEGDAVATAAGAQLAGAGGVAIFQNSGLGNAVNPLTSLTHTFRIPILLVVTHRGEPGGPADEPQHGLMGPITTRMLEVMDIPWEHFPVAPDTVDPVLDRACAHMARQKRPYALVMRKNSVEPQELATAQAIRGLPAWGDRLATEPAPGPSAGPLPPAIGVPPARLERRALAGKPFATRRAMLEAYLQARRPGDIAVASTGFTGRELHALDDRPDQLYMVGSMGCAVSLGLGLALAAGKRHRCIVLDGDGALLMRMGAMAAVGYERPENLVHVVLDNGRHESTGGQATVSHSVDLCAAAAACGYRALSELYCPREFAEELRADAPGPRFIRLPIVPGYPAGLPRPSVSPEAVAQRLREHIAASRAASGTTQPTKAAETS